MAELAKTEPGIGLVMALGRVGKALARPKRRSNDSLPAPPSMYRRGA